MSVRPRFVAPFLLVVVATAACAGTSTTTSSRVAAPTPATLSATPATTDEAAAVMTALCTVRRQPSPNATANAAFFSVHDTLHELADRLNAKDERQLSATVLQATAAVEAHVEDTSTSVPWPDATAALVAVVRGAYAALGITAPTCG